MDRQNLYCLASIFHFIAQRITKPTDRKFAGTIGCLARDRHNAEDRTNVGDMGCRLRHHDGQKGPGHADNTQEVEIHKPFEIGLIQFQKITSKGRTGVVQQHVHLSVNV